MNNLGQELYFYYIDEFDNMFYPRSPLYISTSIYNTTSEIENMDRPNYRRQLLDSVTDFTMNKFGKLYQFCDISSAHL